MNKVILVGASGELGFKILKNLQILGAQVRCLIRNGISDNGKKRINEFSSDILELDFNNNTTLAKSCEGFNIVISAVSGLRPVIVDLQKTLLKAAVSAGVPRFIPSDYSID